MAHQDMNFVVNDIVEVNDLIEEITPAQDVEEYVSEEESLDNDSNSEEFDFDEEADGMAMKAELIKITGQSSVPQVFIGGKFVGGCNDGGMGGVVPLKKSGKLEELLIKSGALVKGATI